MTKNDYIKKLQQKADEANSAALSLGDQLREIEFNDYRRKGMLCRLSQKEGECFAYSKIASELKGMDVEWKPK